MNALTLTTLLVFFFYSIQTVVSSQVHDPSFTPPHEHTRERTIVPNQHLPSLSERQRNPACGDFCRFRLCNFNGSSIGSFTLPVASYVILNDFLRPTLPYVCLPSVRIGQIPRTGEARVFDRRSYVPISSFSPRGLSKPFGRNAILLHQIKFTPWSGVSRPNLNVDQWPFLNRRCMILPIRTYQVLDPSTLRPKRTVRTAGSRNDCVAFRTLAPYLQIQATWDSGDDFDLEVTEPDGDTVDFFEPRSEAGRLNGDNSSKNCNSTLTFGRENILYDTTRPIQRGLYTVRLTHLVKCGPGRTSWTLRVMMNGQLARLRSGFSRSGNMRVVTLIKFNYPSQGVDSSNAPLRD